MRLFDAHSHLQDPRLLADVEGVIRRAGETEVERISCSGVAEDDWDTVRALASRFPQVVPGFGLHPLYVGDRTDGWLASLEGFLRYPGSTVGEIGLDNEEKGGNIEVQEAVFEQQLDLAGKLGRPATVHCRRAWGRLMTILRRRARFAPGMLIHSYSGPVELVAPLVELGAHFSFSGAITRDRNLKGGKAVQAVPLDRMLLETDAPDIMPQMSDRRLPEASNEPANLPHVLRAAAELRGMNANELAGIVWENSCRFFGVEI
jgi:TatD DNase family protein